MKKTIIASVFALATFVGTSYAAPAHANRAFDMPFPQPGNPHCPMAYDMPFPQPGNPHCPMAHDMPFPQPGNPHCPMAH